jgi:adenine-specific DNA-methyltransferase
MTIWFREDVGDNQEAAREIAALGLDFESPKPMRLFKRICELSTEHEGANLVLDFFAGSGTTGHSVINLNREDAGNRKFILVEMGGYFDTVLLPRLKKIIFTPEWKDGKPKRLSTPEEAERNPRILKIVRLESYEDALNNLETRRSQAIAFNSSRRLFA